MAFDVKSYNSLKEKGVINKVEKTNEDIPDALTYAVYIKKFEIDGTKLVQLPDEVQAITNKELVERRAKVLADAKAEAASIDAFIADAV